MSKWLRRNRREIAAERYAEVEAVAELKRFSDSHWRITLLDGETIEFWPGSAHWMHARVHSRGSFDEFLKHLKAAQDEIIKNSGEHKPKAKGGPVICDYCGEPAELVTGAVMYPNRHDLSEKQIYRCVPCKAHVGCHDGTTTPLGRLANASLRKAKQRAHDAFDPLWRGKAKGRRSQMYRWLAEQLGIASDDCHIGMFDEETCDRVVQICERWSQGTKRSRQYA